MLDITKEKRKILILAGSNGHASHSARVFEEIIGIPSVNMSITASLSIDYQLKRIKPYLKEGDILYLPLEYGQIARDKKSVFSGVEGPYAVSYDKESMRDFSFERKMYTYFHFDIKYLISALTEMTLTAIGYKRRITEDNFNDWGDQIGHTVVKAKPYRNYIRNITAKPLSPVIECSYSANALAEFLDWASVNGITVVGGYPVLAKGTMLSEKDDQSLKAFYVKKGHFFLDLDNKGRYPKEFFFDTVDHLAEPYQIDHSKMVARKLKMFIRKRE